MSSIAARSIKHEPLAPYSVKSAIDALPDAERHRLLSSSVSVRRTQGELLDDDEEGDDIPY